MSTLIGLIDQRIGKPHSIGWETNRIGGCPSYMSQHVKPDLVQTCQLCGRPLALVSQLYCPLGGSAFHRCLYVFACPTSSCSSQAKGWRVLRSMLYDPAYDDTHQATTSNSSACEGGMETDSWGEGVDDWGVKADDWGVKVDDWGDESGGGGGGCSPDDWGEGTRLTEPALDGTAAQTEADRPTVSEEQMAATSLAQMSLEEKVPEKNMRDDSTPTPDTNNSSCEVIDDDTLLSDPGRWLAMANILNTKHEQNQQNQMPSTATPSSTTSSSSSPAVVLQPYYLEVVEEPSDEAAVSQHVLGLLKTYERAEGHSVSSLVEDSFRPKSGKGGKTSGGAGNEGYEKTELRHGDRTFHKFLKRLQRCPQQCVRYDRGGQPLLMSELREKRVLPCPLCGGERVFELQLLPALIPWLQGTGEAQSVELDFGTVLVFTCKNNCWPGGASTGATSADLMLLEEAVIVQEDPDSHLYR